MTATATRLSKDYWKQHHSLERQAIAICMPMGHALLKDYRKSGRVNWQTDHKALISCTLRRLRNWHRRYATWRNEQGRPLDANGLAYSALPSTRDKNLHLIRAAKEVSWQRQQMGTGKRSKSVVVSTHKDLFSAALTDLIAASMAVAASRLPKPEPAAK